MKKVFKFISIMTVLAFILAACSFPSTASVTTEQENSVNTAVALTVAAANAGVSATRTPEQVSQPTATTTVEVLPSTTPEALATLSVPPTPTATEDACNRAKFVTDGDITYPDGSVVAPNTSITKTWRVQNTGTCTWNSNYAVVFSSGDQMNAPTVTYLPANVPPGSTVDLSVSMVTPVAEGDYVGNYMLRSDGGVLFGTGTSHMAPLYIEIEVAEALVIPDIDLGGLIFVFPLEIVSYDFAANYCVANWNNATAPGYLACPGTTSDSSGFVVKVDSPKLQDGNTIDGVGLLTHPQWVDGGSIAGTYPEITISNGMNFRATLGCGFGGAGCKVRYFLRYRDEANALHTLEQWDLEYADAPLEVDVDLSGLDGDKVKIVLQVVTNGSSAQDWAYWVNPRIVK